ncbi:MAG TPA: iron export ABC transporter permease subunit FetB [Desulfobacteria bacterium]|nr:iron export ABC transporter permease subunit FetB [Desulfobacteria bacterium]
MTGTVIEIGPYQLILALVFILVAGCASLYHGLRLEKDLLVGTIRTFAQLFLLGYVLKFVFRLNSVWPVLAVFLFMIVFATRIIRSRIKEKQVAFFWPMLVSMVISYALAAILITGVVIGAKPWWKPQYFIPLGGMLIGNSMNAVAISLDRLLGDLKERRQEVEMMLCLGADYHEASKDMVKNAMRAGMIPAINSMMAVGVVFIPGMMTGQILAGADPLVAIRYQIVIMVMIVGATAMLSFLGVRIVCRLCFGAAQQLLLRPEKKRQKG